MSELLIPTNASSVRLVWRAFRATSVIPFLLLSSSSKTIMEEKCRVLQTGTNTLGRASKHWCRAQRVFVQIISFWKPLHAQTQLSVRWYLFYYQKALVFFLVFLRRKRRGKLSELFGSDPGPVKFLTLKTYYFFCQQPN
jgi:hypothetical protein